VPRPLLGTYRWRPCKRRRARPLQSVPGSRPALGSEKPVCTDVRQCAGYGTAQVSAPRHRWDHVCLPRHPARAGRVSAAHTRQRGRMGRTVDGEGGAEAIVRVRVLAVAGQLALHAGTRIVVEGPTAKEVAGYQNMRTKLLAGHARRTLATTAIPLDRRESRCARRRWSAQAVPPWAGTQNAEVLTPSHTHTHTPTPGVVSMVGTGRGRLAAATPTSCSMNHASTHPGTEMGSGPYAGIVSLPFSLAISYGACVVSTPDTLHHRDLAHGGAHLFPCLATW
jgi:hypothetical protein